MIAIWMPDALHACQRVRRGHLRALSRGLVCPDSGEKVGLMGPELHNPIPNAFVGHIQPAFCKKVFPAAKAHCETEGLPFGRLADFLLENDVVCNIGVLW